MTACSKSDTNLICQHVQNKLTNRIVYNASKELRWIKTFDKSSQQANATGNVITYYLHAEESGFFENCSPDE